MKNALVSAIIIGILGAIARILAPYSKRFVKWLIDRLVHAAERKISESGMGAKKKEWVIKKLSLFGIAATDAINEAIDLSVSVMNEKKADLTSSLKNQIEDDIEKGIEKGIEDGSVALSKKLSKKNNSNNGQNGLNIK